MAVIHVTEAEAARDLHAVLSKLTTQDEVRIDAGENTFSLTKVESQMADGLLPRYTQPRLASEILADLREHPSSVLLDPDYSRDVEEFIHLGQEERWINL